MKTLRALLALPWRALKALGTWTVALIILFEEWGWVPLARMLGYLARIPPVAWIERKIAALPPRYALFVFIIPALMLLPLKVGALWLIGRGRAMLGLVVILLAKVIGTAVVARLFMLTQPQLMQLAWFARLYHRWVAWKEKVMARVRASLPWRVARAAKARWRRAWRRLRTGQRDSAGANDLR
jgi:hypothetical protein